MNHVAKEVLEVEISAVRKRLDAALESLPKDANLRKLVDDISRNQIRFAALMDALYDLGCRERE